MPHTIAIVGAGICGMSAALSLAKKGHTITLWEQDDPPPNTDPDAAFCSWERNGAAQFRHPHAFLGLLCMLFEHHYPDLLAELYAAGARRVGFREMLSAELRANYTPEPSDEDLWGLMCRRATMELVMRRHVARWPNITIINGRRVTGLVTDNSTSNCVVRGVRVGVDGTRDTHLADIVVDASGRLSRFPRWLAELGRPIAEEKTDAEIVYYTRHYRLRDGHTEPQEGEHPGAGDLGYLKFGVFPGDAGSFAIILCIPIAEVALKRAIRDPAHFDAICLSIPGLQPWLANGTTTKPQVDRADPTTAPFGIGDVNAVWRHYIHQGEPVALNFFAVGDAAVRTNPLYGRGCSLGVLHANILADTLTDVTDPGARAGEYSCRTKTALRPIFDNSLREDQRGIQRAAATQQESVRQSSTSLRGWLRLAFRDAISAAVREQLHVARGAFRTFHLLEKPGTFLSHWSVRRTIMRYLLRGRKRNAASRLQPGPSRRELHAILDLPRDGTRHSDI